MAAQGFQPQNGSGCGSYDEWAISDQYSPIEDWDNFAFMQENSTTDFQYDESFPTHPDEEAYWQDELEEQSFATNHVYAAELKHGEKFNAKIAPSFDGTMSWFLFYETVQDWLEVTVIEPTKRGPSLRNRLSGQARMYIRAFDRDTLASENGVESVSYTHLTLPTNREE